VLAVSAAAAPAAKRDHSLERLFRHGGTMRTPHRRRLRELLEYTLYIAIGLTILIAAIRSRSSTPLILLAVAAGVAIALDRARRGECHDR